MIVSGGKRVAAVEQRTADLEQQVEALSSQMADTESRLAALGHQLEAALELVKLQAAGLSDAEQRFEALANVVAQQTTTIEQLNEQQERQKELSNRVRADLVRLERQAVIDVAELRQTCSALAERLLTYHRRNADR